MIPIPAESYNIVWLIFITILCIFHTNYLSRYHTFEQLYARNNNGILAARWLLYITVIYFGLRPISAVFADMLGYAETYESGVYMVSEIRNEPVWTIIMIVCHYGLGLSTHLWFLVVAAIGLGCRYFASNKILGNHIYTALLFLCTSFSFTSGMTNIIRSNTAMGFALAGIALFLQDTKKQKLIALLFFFLAFYGHTSTALLIGCFFISKYFIKRIDWCIYIYVACIALSLVMGTYFEAFFSSLGFDDRMLQFTTDTDYSGFAHAGFRWDFLAYSIVPILLGWYILKKREIKNVIYSNLLNTYILANAFWVLVIRAQFSDRFAAISWTMYFIALAYPLLKVKVWNNQPRKVIYGLWFQVGFLWFMELYYSFIR